MNELTEIHNNQIKSPDGMCEKIMRLEHYVIENMEPAKIRWVHRFVPGVYSREMIVPPNTLITGALHKTEHISIFIEGKMFVPDVNGSTVVLSGPQIEIGQPGSKRAGITITECRWLTVHPTDLKTVEECEDAYFTNNPEEVPQKYISVAREFEQEDYALAQRCLLEGGKQKWLPPQQNNISLERDK